MKNAQTRVYSVSEITQRVKFLLEDSFSNVHVEGEISNFKSHSSGHLYFSVKDASSQLSVVMFRSSAQRLRFAPENGLKVIVRGTLTVYERSGSYQINATGMDVCGLGALQLAFEQLKEKLASEGLFAPETKKPLPPFPETIGIVTSPTGAAVRDMLNILGRRFPGLRIVISPVRVQGASAAGEIAKAIEGFNSAGCAVSCDVIIVGRGGGSMEDLWPFNEEAVARAVHGSKIPVISAVGHETDWSICDFASDLRAPTPSAAAELAVRDKDQLADGVLALGDALKSAMGEILLDRKTRLAACTSHYILREPVNLLRQFQQRTDELRDKLAYRMSGLLDGRKARLGALFQRMAALNPLSVLGRGYSITREKATGRIIKDASTVSPGDVIETLLLNGSLVARVQEAVIRDDTAKSDV